MKWKRVIFISLLEVLLSLGEVALVPHQSPISQTNLIFYESLFENVFSHLVIGNAYSFCMENSENMKKKVFTSIDASDYRSRHDCDANTYK
ncbi:aminopeptidase [Shimazuella alba]|uniref:Aminopeptidase n=1 Tax=Shimazuella alba TaxID=2690964 RepID=A0A6I4VRM9_9BACL|nr:aminopeptidase [Shimazuella alba]